LGSCESEFTSLAQEVRQTLLELGGVADNGYEAILMQGDSASAIESVISSIAPREGKWLVIINGRYGRRIAQIASSLEIETMTLAFPEDERPDAHLIASMLNVEQTITHVALVQCETPSGMINPVQELGVLVAAHNRRFFVDAISSFGGIEFDLDECHIDYLVSSADKCLEGVPGISLLLARHAALRETEAYASTLRLDIGFQWQAFETNWLFRLTPPADALIAFKKALDELSAEGGVPGRAARYRRNHELLVRGMRQMGFEECLRPNDQSHIITSFRQPAHPNFVFDEFHQRLRRRGFAIYPGKVGKVDCIRIGTTGPIFENHVYDLLAAIRDTLRELEVEP
jgi:2-aminoethylphosphonate-pyruvate transaminase